MSFRLLNKETINAAALLAGTNSKVGRQIEKCDKSKLCNEVYVCERVVKCENCGKLKAL